MKKITLLLVAVFLSMTSLAHAHSMWINSFESHAHKPGHAMVSLGWGHALPMDDILNSPNGSVIIESFKLYDPQLKVTDLIKPAHKIEKPAKTTKNFDVYAGDIGVQKIALKKDTSPGVYQLAAASKATFYTQYIDKNGKQRMKLKSMDQIKDIAKVLMAVKYQAYAKSFITVGKWSNPKPLGQGLEIIPRTDLSNVKVGDLVEVDVLFYGKPVTSNAKAINYITATSSSFGQSDRFSLFSYLMGGKAQFRVQSRGQWVINVGTKDDVTKDGALKDLYGKTNVVYHGACLSFNVK